MFILGSQGKSRTINVTPLMYKIIILIIILRRKRVILVVGVKVKESFSPIDEAIAKREGCDAFPLSRMRPFTRKKTVKFRTRHKISSFAEKIVT